MTQDEATNRLIKYWQIIVVVIGMAVGYGSITTQIDAMAEDIREQKTEVSDAKDQRTEVEKSVIAIEKDVEFIKKNLDQQDKKLDAILDKVNES